MVRRLKLELPNYVGVNAPAISSIIITNAGDIRMKGAPE
jgi:hypothetical protein